MTNNTNTPATTLPAAELAPLNKIKQYLDMCQAAGAEHGYFWYTEETELHRVLLQLSGDIHGYYSTFSTGDPLLAGWLLCALNRGIIRVEPLDHGTAVILVRK